MTVELSPKLEALLKEKLETGRYQSADEIMREALQLLDEQDRFLTLQRDDIRSKIREGQESLRRNEGVDGESTFDRLESELDRLEVPPRD